MPPHKVPYEDLVAVVKAFEMCSGNVTDAAKKLKLSRTTYRNRLRMAQDQGVHLACSSEMKIRQLEEQLRGTHQELAYARKQNLVTGQIREFLFGLVENDYVVPEWTLTIEDREGWAGVPIAPWADFHWAEVVRPAEVEYVNEYNLEIAKTRFRRLIRHTIDLCKNHVRTSVYPGIVVPMLGDMVAGELRLEDIATNDLPPFQTVIDCAKTLEWGLLQLANFFGNVFVPCVVGNHGRGAGKPWTKQYVWRTLDWLLYTIIEWRFQQDPCIKIHVFDSEDGTFKVLNHRYKITHGSQFRGGDGIIGPIGPVFRGDTKKRAWSAQIDRNYDTLILGHFHQRLPRPQTMMVGSLKGWDEFCARNNFMYSPPVQGLWFTHPKWGITNDWPIYVEPPEKPTEPTRKWVSWEE